MVLVTVRATAVLRVLREISRRSTKLRRIPLRIKASQRQLATNKSSYTIRLRISRATYDTVWRVSCALMKKAVRH